MNLEKEFCSLFDDIISSDLLKEYLTKDNMEKILTRVTTKNNKVSNNNNIHWLDTVISIYVNYNLKSCDEHTRKFTVGLLRNSLIRRQLDYNNMPYIELYNAVDKEFNGILSTFSKK